MAEKDAEHVVIQVSGIKHERALATPRVTTSATWTWLVEGYRRAYARLGQAAGQRDAKETFIPLFETLNWAVAIIDYADKRGPNIDGQILRGFCFARNRVHHQMGRCPRTARRPESASPSPHRRARVRGSWRRPQ